MSLLSPGTPADLAASTAAAFREAYGTEPAVVGRAPGRVNLIGEHTDYNAGTCLPVALAHATYAAVSPRSDDLVRVRSAQTDDEWQGEGIGPGEVTGWASYVAGVAVGAARGGRRRCPGSTCASTAPSRSAPGSRRSAALECSVAVAIAHAGRPRRQWARAAHAWSRPACAPRPRWPARPPEAWTRPWRCSREPDAALLIDFLDHTTRAVPLALADAGLAVLVVDTRVSHALVDGGYASRRTDCETACRELGVPSLREATLDQVESLADSRIRRRARHIVTEIERVADAVAAIERADWRAVGGLFVASHASMRDDFEISCPELDAAVEAALEAGAVGARMTGGGFGGSAVALVPEDALDAVMSTVDTAFDTRGFRRPTFLRAEPSAAAGLC